MARQANAVNLEINKERILEHVAMILDNYKIANVNLTLKKETLSHYLEQEIFIIEFKKIPEPIRLVSKFNEENEDYIPEFTERLLYKL